MIRHRALLYIASAFAVIFLLLGFVTYKSYVPHPELVSDEEARLDACRRTMREQLKLNEIDLKTLAGIHGLCYVEINEADQLRNFTQETSALYNQQNQLPVILWMVVAITLSGVGLAGLQLYGAFILSSSGKGEFANLGGSLEMAKNRLSMNSSVTGLFILVISFAFFYVFVKDVYLIQAVKVTPNESFAGPADLLHGWKMPAEIPKALVGTFNSAALSAPTASATSSAIH